MTERLTGEQMEMARANIDGQFADGSAVMEDPSAPTLSTSPGVEQGPGA